MESAKVPAGQGTHTFFYLSYFGFVKGHETHLVKSFGSSVVLTGHIVHYLAYLSKCGRSDGQLKHLLIFFGLAY